MGCKQSLQQGLYVFSTCTTTKKCLKILLLIKRYLAIWEQILARFENYSDSLYLEIFNDRMIIFATVWNEYLLDD